MTLLSAEIPGFPFYAVRSDGTVWSERRQRVMSPGVDRYGYHRQPLRRADGKPVCCYVHRLVALAFVPLVPGCPDVDHIDGNPRNNVPANLRWVTHAKNMQAAFDRRGNWLADGPRRQTPIDRIDPDTGERVTFASMTAACADLDRLTIAAGGRAKPAQLRLGNISHARDRAKVAYGFRWETPTALDVEFA